MDELVLIWIFIAACAFSAWAWFERQREEHQESPPPVKAKHWLADLAKAHHILLVGETGSGKTTLALALLSFLEGEAVIIDPKDAPNKWGGLPVYRLSDQATFEPMEQAMQGVLTELRRRLKAHNNGEPPSVRLSIIIDEFPTVAKFCPTAAELLTLIGSIGRELNMSAIILTQRKTVKALGIAGDGEARDNFTTVLCGKAARKAGGTGDFPIVLEYQDESTPVNSTAILGFSRQKSRVRPAQLDLKPVPNAVPDAVPDPTLAMLQTELPTAKPSDKAHSVLPAYSEPEPELVPDDSEYADLVNYLIQYLAENGHSKTSIAKALRIRRQKALQIVRNALQ